MNYFRWLTKYKKPLLSLLTLIIVVVVLNHLLLKDVIYESDDYKLHAVRVANYYLALKQGQFPVRWGPNLNGSFGYPAFNYMYHTPYIIATVFHALGLSIQRSLNFTVLLSLFLGITSSYLFLSGYLKTESKKIVLSLFFIFNPYTLLNVYWRGAVGELYFYALVPLFLLAIKNIIDHKQNYLYQLLLSFITATLIISHLPSMVLLALLTLTYLLTHQKNLNLKKLLTIFKAGFIGVLLSSWYWLPAYFEQSLINYQKSGSLLVYQTQFVKLFSLLNFLKTFNSSNLFLEVLQLGPVVLIATFLGIYLVKYLKIGYYWLGLVLLSLFFTNQASSSLYHNLKLLKYIQFPWRFLWLINFASLMLLVQVLRTKQVKTKYQNIILIFILLATLISAKTYIVSKGSTSRADFEWYHPTFATGSSFNEHLPKGAKTSYYFPDELVFVYASESGQLTQRNLEKHIHQLAEIAPKVSYFNGTKIEYSIKANNDIIILHKRLFWPGWEAELNQKPTQILTNIPEYEGVIALKVNKDQVTKVKVEFTGYTKLRKLAEITSIITLLFLVGQGVLKHLE